MWTRKKKSEPAALDMTPLVDMVFLLIIFFMLSTTFIVTPGIRMDLPRGSSDAIVSEKKEIVISIDKEGSVYFNKERVDDSALAAMLRATCGTNRDTAVMIRGDKEAGFGKIVQVLDMVRNSGLHRIAIVTEKKTTEP